MTSGQARREDLRPTAVAARLTLVSHARAGVGPVSRFSLDTPLDANELRQAAAAGAATVSLRLGGGAVLCDRTARTRQTAQALGLAADAVAALSDIDVGTWAGRRLDEIAEPDLVAWVTDPGAAPHGGESVVDLLGRIRSWLATGLFLSAPDPTGATAAANHVVAVTHPAVVRAVLVIALRCPPEVFWRIDVPPLTATRLHWRGDWTLRYACRPLK